MKHAITRRHFLAAAATAAVAPALIPARALGRAGAPAASDRIAMAVIGLGSRGPSLIGPLLGFPEVQLVAVCDVYRSKADRVAANVQAQPNAAGCVALQDFREILARPDIDAVAITAPEHWHAVMAIEAMKAGKDVYCEKALSLTVPEGRAVCDATRRTGRVLQAGTQQRSDRNFRHACELARSGALGTLRAVTVAVPGGRRKLNLRPGPVPDDLDYDLWLGPSPRVPYRQGVSTYNWYFLRDYCAGWIQSWGVHHLDIALWGAPGLMASTLEAEGDATYEPDGDADVAFGWNVRMTAPDGLRLNFHEDGSSPFGHGCRFEGDAGWVHVSRNGIHAGPESLLTAVVPPGPHRLPVSTNHVGNFLQSIRTRRDPIAPVEACHAATTLSLIADIATRAGRRLTWEWGREQFVGDEPANRMLSRALRAPWTLS